MYTNTNTIHYKFEVSHIKITIFNFVVNWWNFYGTDTPELKEMAMRILNLTTSSSGCERNWSTFEMVIQFIY